MSDFQSEIAMNFSEMCQCSLETANAYLQSCDWDLEAAVSFFFDNGGAPLSGQPIEEINAPPVDVVSSSVCSHIEQGIQPLKSSTLVYKEECVYCFSTWTENKGIDVCLSCYQGFCTGPHDHSNFHFKKSGHPLYLRLFRREIPSPAPSSPTTENPKPQLTKLAIGVEGGAMEPSKRYETEMQVVCWACDRVFPAEGFVVFGGRSEKQVREIGEKILLCASGEKEKEICQWEDENLKPCPHCSAYQLPEPVPQVELAKMRCEDCELTKNLWLCLECGQLHCGRQQWNVSEIQGNGHAIEHFKQTGHCLVVKVASISENHADVHCYACDDRPEFNYGDVLLESVRSVLHAFGVLKDGQLVGLDASQHEQSLLELNLFVNTEFDFSMNDSHGDPYPLHASSSACGLDNLGNSCYLNAILQCLIHLHSVQRLLRNAFWANHFQFCASPNPSNCILCQFFKVAEAFQNGGAGRHVAPRLLKQAIGAVAPAFNNNQQQDCFEFLTVFLDALGDSAWLRRLFRIPFHYSMKCSKCGNRMDGPQDEEICLSVQISEQTKQLSQMIATREEDEYVELECSTCHCKTLWNRSAVLDDFPTILCVRINRFIVDMQTCSIKKNTSPVEIDPEIYVMKCLDPDLKLTEKRKYRLSSVCLHRGNKADFGHYVAAYREEGVKEWVLCNDSKVVLATDAPISECYLAFYETVFYFVC